MQIAPETIYIESGISVLRSKRTDLTRNRDKIRAHPALVASWDETDAVRLDKLSKHCFITCFDNPKYICVASRNSQPLEYEQPPPLPPSEAKVLKPRGFQTRKLFKLNPS